MVIEYALFNDFDRKFLAVGSRVFESDEGQWRPRKMTYPSCLKFMPYADITGEGTVDSADELGISKSAIESLPPRPGLVRDEDSGLWISTWDGSQYDSEGHRVDSPEGVLDAEQDWREGQRVRVREDANISHAGLLGQMGVIRRVDEEKGILVDMGNVTGWMRHNSLDKLE